jgi:hypothetical protein
VELVVATGLLEEKVLEVLVICVMDVLLAVDNIEGLLLGGTVDKVDERLLEEEALEEIVIEFMDVLLVGDTVDDVDGAAEGVYGVYKMQVQAELTADGESAQFSR